MVNGPEDLPRVDLDAVDWDSIVWAGPAREVERLRQRIFKAAREEDWPKARNLQKLMLRSRSNTLISVRQVTQRNAGRMTAGIDGEVALTSGARAGVAVRVHQSIRSWQPRAVRRVYIPKGGNSRKLRPLGIPVILDPWTGVIRTGLRTRWNPSGRPGLSLAPTGSGRVVAARTRLSRSTPRARALRPGGCGRWTRIWLRHSTGLTTTAYWRPSAISPAGG